MPPPRVSLRTPGVVISTGLRPEPDQGEWVSLRTPGVVISTRLKNSRRSSWFHSEPQGSSFQLGRTVGRSSAPVSLRTPGVVISTRLFAESDQPSVEFHSEPQGSSFQHRSPDIRSGGSQVSLRTPGVVISTGEEEYSVESFVSLRTPGVVISTRAEMRPVLGSWVRGETLGTYRFPRRRDSGKNCRRRQNGNLGALRLRRRCVSMRATNPNRDQVPNPRGGDSKPYKQKPRSSPRQVR